MVTRERLPSTRELNWSCRLTSGPATIEFGAGLDFKRIACAAAGETAARNSAAKNRPCSVVFVSFCRESSRAQKCPARIAWTREKGAIRLIITWGAPSYFFGGGASFCSTLFTADASCRMTGRVFHANFHSDQFHGLCGISVSASNRLTSVGAFFERKAM